MELAVEQREHPGGSAGDVRQPVAAREPANDRREHPCPNSEPWTGNTSQIELAGYPWGYKPQWSTAHDRREHLHYLPRHGGKVPIAMEPCRLGGSTIVTILEDSWVGSSRPNGARRRSARAPLEPGDGAREKYIAAWSPPSQAGALIFPARATVRLWARNGARLPRAGAPG